MPNLNRLQARLGEGVIFISSNIAIDTCLKTIFKRKQESKKARERVRGVRKQNKERKKEKRKKEQAFTLCLSGQMGYNLISKKKIL